MHIISISTYNYRNLEDQTIELHPSVNFIIGKNGQGKTNLIEAVSLLSRGKSFRTSKSRELVKNTKKEASVFSEIENDGHRFNLGISFKSKEKEYYYNHDKLNSLKEFLGKLISISFSPDDLNLIKGGPLERRNFLDKHILDINSSYIEAFFSYQRALKNKSNILKTNSQINKNDLIPWNQILAESGEKIMKERQSLLERIKEGVFHYYNVFAGQDTAVSLQLKNTYLDYDLINASQIFDAYNSNIEKEISNRACLVGVHKDELEVNLNNKNSRFYASQGETRSLVLAMKIAVLDEIERRREITPVLLLDDVDSELDISRRQALADIIFSKKRQIIISGTQLPYFEQKKTENYLILGVSQGVVNTEQRCE